MQEELINKVESLQQNKLGDDIVNPPQDDYFEEMFNVAWNNVEGKSISSDNPLSPKNNETPAKTKKKLKKDLLLYLRSREKAIIQELEKVYTSDKLAEIKDFQDLWDRLLTNIKGMFQSTNVKPLVDEFTEKFYVKGLISSEYEFSQNFFPDKKQLAFLKDYNFDLVKGMTDELADKLKGVLQRAHLQQKPFTEVKDEVAKLFDNNEVRAKAIVRTEEARAGNLGKLEGAKQSGILQEKSILNPLNDKTSPLCRRMMEKYGDKGISLNTNFKDDKTGKSWDSPPFHVNCRTSLRTFRVKEE